MTAKALLCSIPSLLLLAGPAFGQPYTFKPFDVRCDGAAASCPAGLAPGDVATQTSAKGINARGDIVGFYVDTFGHQHGFLLQDGQYTALDFPVAGQRGTIANGINDQGEIVGQYLLPINPGVPDDSPLYCPKDIPPPPTGGSPTPDAACIKAFHYARGVFTTIMFPGHPGAIAQRITADGDVYGCLHDHDLGPSMFGAAWNRSFGKQHSVVVTDRFSLTANGGELSDPMANPMSMNNGATPGGSHTIAGLVVDMTNVQHGYLVRNGTLAEYDPTPDTNLTAIWDINPEEQFVGTYRQNGEPAGKRHGFLQSTDDAAAVTLDVTFVDGLGNTVNAFATIAFGINPDGVIVGQYTVLLPNGKVGPPHGFVALPTDRN
jgi:probable HAF family extracellular repeat protein